MTGWMYVPSTRYLLYFLYKTHLLHVCMKPECVLSAEFTSTHVSTRNVRITVTRLHVGTTYVQASKALCNKCIINSLVLVSLYFPGAQLLHLFPCGADTYFKSVPLINLNMVAMASTSQPYNPVLKMQTGKSKTFLFRNYEMNTMKYYSL